jgi:hypothetical protein
VGGQRLGGVVTTGDLAAAGMSAGQVRRAVRRGALLRLRYGTYAPVADAATPAGFEVVHFTWQQVTRTPDQVVASLKTAFRRGLVR